MASAHSSVVSSVRAIRSSSGKLIVDIETGQVENRLNLASSDPAKTGRGISTLRGA
jgi:hypothetical protein